MLWIILFLNIIVLFSIISLDKSIASIWDKLDDIEHKNDVDMDLD